MQTCCARWPFTLRQSGAAQALAPDCRWNHAECRMPATRNSATPDASPPFPAERRHSPPATTQRDRRRGFLWPVLFGSVLALLAGTFVILWPLVEAAGAGVALAMALALLVLSLTPVMLLREARAARRGLTRRIMRRTNESLASGGADLTFLPLEPPSWL